MDILDYFYTNSPSNERFFARKFNFPKNMSFKLTGARATGKSVLVIEYLNSLKNGTYLYIDCQDPIFILEFLDSLHLEQFIKQEKIELLVLDHYFDGFLDNMPKVNRLIIISTKNINIDLPTFKLIPLDFEEFLNFSRTTNSTQAFNLYTKRGSLPALSISKDFNAKAKELFFEKFEPQEGKVLLILAIFHTKITTPNQIYIRAKEYFKISKDWLYKTIKSFEKEGIIYQIPLNEKGFGKKLILYDFAFAKYLNKHQNIFAIIDSIVALALIKHNFKFKALNSMLGYITCDNEIILISLFESEESIRKKHYKEINFFIKLNATNVTIITISNRYSYKIKNVEFNAIPFEEWSIMIAEE